MAFRENLQFIRDRAGLSQEQLAVQIEVSRQSVSKWEGGQSFPEMETLLHICNLYDVNLDVLLRGSVEESQVADTAQYDAFMNRFSRRISFAVGGILAGVGGMLLLQAWGGFPDGLSGALFLFVVSICVVVIVASGMQQQNFCKRHPVIADFYTQEEKEVFHQKFVWYIAGGVGAILFGAVLLILSCTYLPEREPYETLVVGCFMLIVAGAVTALVYGGMQDDKYKIWKYNRDNNPTPEARRRLNLIGAACGVVMLLATAVYVGLGLTKELWGSAWWVFPVGGLLCGVVHVILDPYKGEE